MNLFQTIFINVILLMFPILVYLIYLSTDKNITKKEQKLYLVMTLYASFYLLYKFSFYNKLIDFKDFNKDNDSISSEKSLYIIPSLVFFTALIM